MASDAASGGVLFPLDSSGEPTGFNELVTYYPEFDRTRKSTVNCIVVRDNEEGTREVRGDGVRLNDRNARSTRRSIIIEAPATLDVRDSQPTKDADAFLVDGEVWHVKRILGRDLNLMSILCVHSEDREIRNQSRVG